MLPMICITSVYFRSRSYTFWENPSCCYLLKSWIYAKYNFYYVGMTCFFGGACLSRMTHDIFLEHVSVKAEVTFDIFMRKLFFLLCYTPISKISIEKSQTYNPRCLFVKPRQLVHISLVLIFPKRRSFLIFSALMAANNNLQVSWQTNDLTVYQTDSKNVKLRTKLR